MVKTMAHRIFYPIPVWKLLPDRQFNAATKRFDSFITGLIAQERGKLAAADIASTTTDTTTGTGVVSDISSVKESCLLTQLVQYGVATEAASAAASITANKESESSRYALTSKEVLLILS
jgi:hypothetical protein